MSKTRNRSCLSGDVKICEATPEEPRDPSFERCGRRPLRQLHFDGARARPRCRRIARAHHHCARSPADGSGGASQVWSCAALAVIFIGERKPLLSACPSRPPSRVDHEVRHKPGLEAASLGSPAADFVPARTSPRPSSTCFFAVALGDEERGVGACASHPSPAHLTCDLPDVPCGSWVLCDRRPPSADGYNDSQASLTFLLETCSR